MGQLYYGNTDEAIEVSDRLLAYVKVVVATKLRRNESFTLSWHHASRPEDGRSTIWLQPAIPMRFVFGTPDLEKLDTSYLKELAEQANSTAGMTIDLDDALAAHPENVSPIRSHAA